ncbi:hypothetical protein I4U23_023054 [Adineta vaga]|nr:hypothetical protein I4U23_023054 [Adineta vaga]
MNKKPGAFIDKENEEYKRCLMVHDLDETVKASAIKKVIARNLDSNNVKFKVTWNESAFIHNRKSQCAVIIFSHEEYVNEIMRKRPIQLFGKELSVSRQLSRKHYLSHKITCGLLVELSNECSPDGLIDSVEKYFRQYGSINYREYSEKKIYFIFDDYDSVDRIVLEKVTHKVKEIPLKVQKVLVPNNRRTVPTSDMIEYCIHVTSLPNDITGEELSKIFRVDITNILIRPYNELQNNLVENERKPVEVWIRDIGSNESLQKLVQEKNGYCLRGCRIQCQVIPTPVNHFDLCRSYRKGNCRFSICCRKKHIRCVQPVGCRNTQCWYGHDEQRKTHSQRLPISDKDGYRVRISNFPPGVTRPEIFDRLRLRFYRDQKNLIICNENDPSAPPIVYVTDEDSLAFVKELIHAWHDQTFSRDQHTRMKCQLELNVDYYNSTIGNYHSLTPQQVNSPTPSTISSINSRKERHAAAVKGMRKQALKTIFSVNNHDQDQRTEQLALPSPWSLEDPMLLNETDQIYTIVDHTDTNKSAYLRIYSKISDKSSRLRVERHRLALQRLSEVDGVSKLIDCFYGKSTISSNSWKKLWLMTEKPEGTSLDRFLADELPSFEDKLLIILELIDLINEIHQCGVIHRNLTPSKIYIEPCVYDDEEEGFCLQITDFDFAHISSSNEIEKTSDVSFFPVDNPVTNDFYLPVQFEVKPLNNNDIDEEKELSQSERQSPGIDTSYICAILFSMMTYREPKVARNFEGKAPHQVPENNQLIQDTLVSETGRCLWKIHALNNHLQLIFDRAFGNLQQQWSIGELKYQIRMLLEILNTMKEQDIIVQNSSMVVLNEPFLRLGLLISRMKEEFIVYYSRIGSINWSNNENNEWSGHSGIIQNYDLLNIGERQLQLKFKVNRLGNDDQIQISVYIKMNESTIVELPLGSWKEKDIETILEMFIRELSCFCHLIF